MAMGSRMKAASPRVCMDPEYPGALFGLPRRAGCRNDIGFGHTLRCPREMAPTERREVSAEGRESWEAGPRRQKLEKAN